MSEQSIEGMQRVLAAEHAAVYLYAALAGVTSRSSAGALFASLDAAYDAHRDQRDQVQARLRALDATPVAAEAAYRLPDDLSSPRRVRRAAADAEQACATTWAGAIAETSGELRRTCLSGLSAAALRSLEFGAEPEPFPGLTELDDG